MKPKNRSAVSKDYIRNAATTQTTSFLNPLCTVNWHGHKVEEEKTDAEVEFLHSFSSVYGSSPMHPLRSFRVKKKAKDGKTEDEQSSDVEDETGTDGTRRRLAAWVNKSSQAVAGSRRNKHGRKRLEEEAKATWTAKQRATGVRPGTAEELLKKRQERKRELERRMAPPGGVTRSTLRTQRAPNMDSFRAQVHVGGAPKNVVEKDTMAERLTGYASAGQRRGAKTRGPGLDSALIESAMKDFNDDDLRLVSIEKFLRRKSPRSKFEQPATTSMSVGWKAGAANEDERVKKVEAGNGPSVGHSRLMVVNPLEFCMGPNSYFGKKRLSLESAY